MEPLASKLRPKTFKEFCGQEHLVGPGQPLRTAVERKHLFSFILWGPPGTGKTTLARLYAAGLQAELYELSAVSAGREDIRKILAADAGGRPKALFLDEIHRFNKAQQDFLLPAVETGELTLIGATTENPSFEVIPALLSRCRVFTLEELSAEEMSRILERSEIELDEDSRQWLINMAGGDARQALTVLENTVRLYEEISVENLQRALQSRYLRYDKQGDEHYYTISAFIKSMRSGSADAALYYLSRMLSAGEDPKFIARRLVVFASEDIGLAQPTALVVANAVFRAVEAVGLPEAEINLAHGAAYLAGCRKDRSAYEAYKEAARDARELGNLPVPLKLRNAPTALTKELGYGQGYEKYSREGLLPEKLQDRRYLKPQVPDQKSRQESKPKGFKGKESK